MVMTIMIMLSFPLLHSLISKRYTCELVVSDEAAREALTDMPPRSEEELDAVTLHNQARVFFYISYCCYSER